MFFCQLKAYTPDPDLHSFPTRRSSDLGFGIGQAGVAGGADDGLRPQLGTGFLQDRKSTRLNSSHVRSSYAVFCLKKKKPEIMRLKTNLLRNIPDAQLVDIIFVDDVTRC